MRSPIRLVSPEAIGGPTPRENIVGISIPAFFFLFGAGGFLVTRKWIDRFIDDGAAWVVLAFQKAPVQCLFTLLGALVGYFLWILYCRVALEVLAALFRIADAVAPNPQQQGYTEQQLAEMVGSR